MYFEDVGEHSRSYVVFREIYFSRVSRTGHKIGDEFRVTYTNGHSSSPRLVWNGQYYGLFWIDYSESYDDDALKGTLYYQQMGCQ